VLITQDAAFFACTIRSLLYIEPEMSMTIITSFGPPAADAYLIGRAGTLSDCNSNAVLIARGAHQPR
jgi:hypothetical protein